MKQYGIRTFFGIIYYLVNGYPDCELSVLSMDLRIVFSFESNRPMQALIDCRRTVHTYSEYLIHQYFVFVTNESDVSRVGIVGGLAGAGSTPPQVHVYRRSFLSENRP